MKKIILITFLSIVSFSCKEEIKTSKEKESKVALNSAEENLYRGDFIFLKDAAVLKGDNFIYGVSIDELSKQLAERVKEVKVSDFDMVPVAVKGKISQKQEGQEGWDEILTITEIVLVGNSPSKIDVKIEEKK
ncbi:MAG: hypothetical protein P8H34_01810 [Flavobacteriaceae bacterium]|jgi:hypothetical protein|nr:hypothetical protein [Flavobacteriaceae bacterium]MDB2495373.1 hypothetical protein [Flavobacteriaceae bacterium]MDG1327015.1 hypothetical protein [Flavobacteriaceae bacterium]MDG1790167.1 hypothetical protein [Flavobacteriaceae bacterium]MDG2446324.1 hypothetical protein [Flavobacteriaceae bacterium]|tara:strand:+ start:1966 stop:2364 length:399 start_codon:yes stop_codon:yes gene_type:complete